MSIGISIETKYLPSSDPSLPALALQVTCLVNSYMLWIGTTDASPEDVSKALSEGNLAHDWACAMPPITSGAPASATWLFRSSGSEVSMAIAQRLARRFRKQIYLSVDIPPIFSSMGQSPRIALEMEKGIVETLKRMDTD